MRSPFDEAKRMVEALLFASTEPLSDAAILTRLPGDQDLPAILTALQADYADRGVVLVCRGGKWLFQTAGDLSFLLRDELEVVRKLSRAGIETLATIAYHQPVTRAEIEDIRGVGLSKGTLDVLMEAGWVKPVGRKATPGRPVIYGTTQAFLIHFGLESIDHLPGLGELKAAGLLEPIEDALEQLSQSDQQSLPLPEQEPIADADDGTTSDGAHDDAG